MRVQPPRRAAPPGRGPRRVPARVRRRSWCGPMVAAVRLHRRERFALVQVHSLPDFLVFAALPLRLVGVPVLLDLHEAMPEFFRSRFPRASNPHRPSAAACSRSGCRSRLSTRDHHGQPGDARPARRGSACRRRRSAVVVNSPSLARFDPARIRERAFRADGTAAARLHRGADADLRAGRRGRGRRPDRGGRGRTSTSTSTIYGRGDRRAGLAAAGAGWASRTASRSTAASRSRTCPAAVARADIGVGPDPARPVHGHEPLDEGLRVRARWASPSSRRACRWSSGRSRPARSSTYDPGDAAAMAAAILAFADDPAARERAVARTAEVVQARPGSARRSATSRSSIAWRVAPRRSRRVCDAVIASRKVPDWAGTVRYRTRPIPLNHHHGRTASPHDLPSQTRRQSAASPLARWPEPAELLSQHRLRHRRRPGPDHPRRGRGREVLQRAPRGRPHP